MTRSSFTNASAADYRRHAMQCAAQANDPWISGDERAQLLKMRESLLAMADMEEWLNGRDRRSA